MRTFAFICLIAFIPTFVYAGLDLEKKLDSGYIIKEITIPEGQDYATVLVKSIIDSSPKAVWAALINIGRWPKWLPMNRKAWFLSPEAEKLVTPNVARSQSEVLAINKLYPPSKISDKPSGHWEHIAYEEYDLPWPIKNEWVVRRYKYDESVDVWRASWRLVNTKRDEDDGYWEVRPWKGGSTYITYLYRVKAKDHVPHFVFKTAVSLTVNSMIKALRHEAAKVEENMAKAPAINN